MSTPGWTHEYEVILPADPARVWRAVTDPSELTRWFAEGVEVEPHAGGKFRFWGRHTYGAPKRGRAHQRITRFEAGRELAFEWEIEGVESEGILRVEPDPSHPAKSRGGGGRTPPIRRSRGGACATSSPPRLRSLTPRSSSTTSGG